MVVHNNAVHAAAPKGWLCVKYIDPDGRLLRTNGEQQKGTAPDASGAECSFGVPLNIAPGAEKVTQNVSPRSRDSSL